MNYKPTIGLEIHAELKTKTKMFCDSLNDSDEKHPNINVCPICMGHPGTLPVINQEAVKKVIQAGLALHCQIADESFFERKNYFYPDLPKGYQISQYQKPLCRDGYLEILSNDQGLKTKANNESLKTKAIDSSGFSRSPLDVKRIRIERIHLEEDAGRLLHESLSTGSGRPASLVDYNRAGVPLMELVTRPDLENGNEVKKFAEEFQLILRYLNVSDANMEKGQMRVEVNISLSEILTSSNQKSKIKNQKLGTKVEIKNLNSIKVAMQAVEYEIKRQSELLDSGERVIQETRGWDEVRGVTVSQRSKEEAHDYRYFPEPDLPPLFLSISEKLQRRGPPSFSRELLKEASDESVAVISNEFSNIEKDSQRKGGVPPTKIDVDGLLVSLPELPQQRRDRFKKQYNLPERDIEIFTKAKHLGDYYEKVATELDSEAKVEHLKSGSVKEFSDEKHLLGRLHALAANFIITEFPVLFNMKDASELEDLSGIKVEPEAFAELMVMFFHKKLSSSATKVILKEMTETGLHPEQIMKEKDLGQVSDSGELTIAVKNVIANNQRAVEDYKKGKQESLKFLVGQVMKETKGKANPQVAEELLKKELVTN
ncbi:MAG: Asp-tRNA(Asn)/Glu-tRNA(Gln) amidotransferase subunit GatB [Parcubacteria group bacterium]|nr:Asp-tRNA(Asn)/Glu-tRNA(Gln) amidotransferase subunit GatB [Parcubacteria group bacterium]